MFLSSKGGFTGINKSVSQCFFKPLISQVRVFVFIDGDRRVVVQSLSGQHLGQVALVAAGLLQLGPFVLEPDLDLGLVEAEFRGEAPSSVFVEVAIVVELLSQSRQLFRRERRSGPLFLGSGSCGGSSGAAAIPLFDLSRPRS